jgi:hypothetical protein
MNAADLLTAPPPTHLVYIPFVLFIGAVIGFLFGRRAGMKEGQAELLGRGSEDDDLL